MSKKHPTEQSDNNEQNSTLLAVTTCTRPWYFALSLAYLAEADTTGMDTCLYIDSGFNPLNKEIAERTNEKHHIFDRIVYGPDHPHSGCHKIRNYIFNEFRDGDWERLITCDDDLVYEPTLFRDMQRDLDELQTIDDRFHFAFGLPNVATWRGNVGSQPLHANDREYRQCRFNGMAVMIGDRDGWLGISPEPFTIPPFDGYTAQTLMSCIRRAGLLMGLRVTPPHNVQHLCNANTVAQWHSEWANAYPCDINGKHLEVPGFPLDRFKKIDEQHGGNPADLSKLVREQVAARGDKVWLPEGEYEGAKPFTGVRGDFVEQNPPPKRLYAMPNGEKPGVLIAVPTRDGKIHHRLAMRIPEWLRRYSDKYRINTLYVPHLRWPDAARTRIVDTFMTDTWEWLLQVDADVVPPGNILDMIEHDVDIVQGPAVIRRHGMMEWVGKKSHDIKGFHDRRFYRATKELQGATLVPVQVTAYDESGEVEHESILTLPIPGPYEEGLVEYDTLGTGCLLARRCVFERIGIAPFFTQFDALKNLVNTEDGTFSEIAKAAGFKQYADTSMRCEHWHGDIELSSLFDLANRGMMSRVFQPGDDKRNPKLILDSPDPVPIGTGRNENCVITAQILVGDNGKTKPQKDNTNGNNTARSEHIVST